MLDSRTLSFIHSVHKNFICQPQPPTPSFPKPSLLATTSLFFRSVSITGFLIQKTNIWDNDSLSFLFPSSYILFLCFLTAFQVIHVFFCGVPFIIFIIFFSVVLLQPSQLKWWQELMTKVFFFFFGLCHTACGIFVPQSGMKASTPALEACCLKHWTTWEVSDDQFS